MPGEPTGMPGTASPSGFGSLAQTGFWLCWSDGTDAINASETDCLAGQIGFEPANPSATYLIGITGYLAPR
jgi:hypothetical protein